MAFGYTSSDAESEHALIVAENALQAVRLELYDQHTHAAHCRECGDEIPPARRTAAPGCYQCVSCRSLFELSNRKRTVKMLDRIL
jgi:phage/conjugal plasmid C-4 type zinc finger TraR family protein